MDGEKEPIGCSSGDELISDEYFWVLSELREVATKLGLSGEGQLPKARSLLITSDGGGSNGNRLRQWNMELQKLADSIGLPITVCRFPPGTGKWNKVKHRLFSSVSSNWRGEPLRDYETIVNLLAGTTTAKVCKATCRLDRRTYAVGKRSAQKSSRQ